MNKRKATRLKKYDYAQNGAYFITICSYKMKRVFGTIVGQGLAPAEMKLSKYGKIAQEQLFLLEERYKTIKIDNFVVMPNHIHIILTIQKTAGASPCPTVSDVICAYKSLTTIICKKNGYGEEKVFQSSFYDHIIRDEDDYITKAQYIENNPSKWFEDKYYNQ